MASRHWLFFFFFKQKTAYEIGTGDWSSDVCSSDLPTKAIASFLLQGFCQSKVNEQATLYLLLLFAATLLYIVFLSLSVALFTLLYARVMRV